MTNDKFSFEIDCEKICARIENFIRNTIKNSKTHGVVIGISGGIDSAVVAALAVRALGKENVLGLFLPRANLDPTHEKDATKLAKQLGIQLKKISIAGLVNELILIVDQEMGKNRLIIGNAMARFRMIMLYAHANQLNYLVIGTSNKSEIMIGYITKYGDGGIDFEPCGDLYKTQMRILAKHLKIPQEIITKIPTAALWDGQTTEGELGINYDILDKILLAINKGYTKNQIMQELAIDEEIYDKINRMIKRSEHKRKMPPILLLDKK